MKTRRVFKDDKMKNLIVQGDSSTGGVEVEFPDVSDDETPQKGDKVLVDGKEAESGCCTLPDGTYITWEKGTVTKVGGESDHDKDGSLGFTSAVIPGACKAFSSWDKGVEQKIEILGNNRSTPYRKGNRVLINGEKKSMAKVEMNGKEIKILNGRISSVKNLNAKQAGTRRVMKPKGKKMIGIPVKPKREKSVDSIEKPEKAKERKPTAFKLDKFIHMKKR